MSIGGGGVSGGTGKDRYAELAALLRTRREELGLSRRTLAETTGLSYPYIAQLEGGYRAPSVSSARRLADALRLPVEDIVHAADETSSSAPPDPDPHAREWIPNLAYAPSIDEDSMGRAAPAPPSPAASAAPLPAPPPPLGTPPPRRRRGFARGLSTRRTTDPVARGVADAAQDIASILRTLPAEARLDALAFAQREVMAEIVEERSSRPAPDAGSPGP